jgi:hypothetical protein
LARAAEQSNQKVGFGKWNENFDKVSIWKKISLSFSRFLITNNKYAIKLVLPVV